MFAVIYQRTLKAGREEEYKILWHQIVAYFIEHKGAIGSCLHKTHNNVWVAYSKWPSKEIRDAAWPKDDKSPVDLPYNIKTIILKMKDCIKESYPEICMDVVEDLLNGG